MTVCIVSTDISLSLTIGQLGVSDLARAVWWERESCLYLAGDPRWPPVWAGTGQTGGEGQ